MIYLDVITNDSIFTRNLTKGESISMPIAHGEGNYQASENTLRELQDNDCIAFKYSRNKFRGQDVGYINQS